MRENGPCKRTRNAQILLAFLGVTVYGLQVSSLALGLVAMTDATAASNFTTLNYTLKQKSLISGLLGCGNTVGNMIAAIMSHRLPLFKVLPIASGILSGTMAAIVPAVAVHLGYNMFCCVVFIQGLGLSFIYPSVYGHMSAWVLPEDQGKFSWVWSGNQVGHLIMMSQSGLLHCGPGGWPSIFYAPGFVGIVWGITFIIWGSSSPVLNHNPSEIEPDNLTEREKLQQRRLPWHAMISSGPMWALLAVQISDFWVGDCLMRPIFLSSVCHFSVHQLFLCFLVKINPEILKTFIVSFVVIGEGRPIVTLLTGLILAIGNSLNIISGLVYALLDVQLTRTFGLDFSRKFWTAVGLYGGAVALSLVGILHENPTVAAILLVLTATFNSATHPGYMSAILNAAPNMAGAIAGVFNTITSMVSCTGPLYTGFIVKNENELTEWRTVFLTAASVYVTGCTIFLIFGSTETQRWSCHNSVSDKCIESSELLIESKDE